MSSGITITRSFRAKRSPGRRKEQGEVDQPSTRVPRITRLMALAIYFDQLISEGVVADQAEIARLGHVSRARVTQIMNLLNLAPDIQEELLFLERKSGGLETLSERTVRPITSQSNWRTQRRLWRASDESIFG